MTRWICAHFYACVSPRNAIFQVSDQEKQVAEALREIPADAIVMAQDPLVPHLSHREDIYLLPWVRGGNQPDYVLLDPQMRTYPVGPDEYRTLFIYHFYNFYIS